MEELDIEMLKIFYDTTKSFIKFQKKVFLELGVNYCEGKSITALYQKKELTQRELSEECDMDTPQTCRIVMRLMLKKIIKRHYKNGNRKTMFIALTEKGNNMAKDILSKMEILKNEFFNNVSTDEKQRLIETVNKMLIN